MQSTERTVAPHSHGAQLAVDITLRSALTAFGLPCPKAAQVSGAILQKARRDREAKYVELLHGDRCHLVVVGIETCGRWSTEAAEFITQMASGRAREAPCASHLEAEVDEDVGNVLWSRVCGFVGVWRILGSTP